MHTGGLAGRGPQTVRPPRIVRCRGRAGELNECVQAGIGPSLVPLPSCLLLLIAAPRCPDSAAGLGPSPDALHTVPHLCPSEAGVPGSASHRELLAGFCAAGRHPGVSSGGQ